jgi:hypothetical protein
MNEFMRQLKRRARLVADGTGLENRKGFTLLVGSNPTPSAQVKLSINDKYAVENCGY